MNKIVIFSAFAASLIISVPASAQQFCIDDWGGAVCVNVPVSSNSGGGSGTAGGGDGSAAAPPAPVDTSGCVDAQDGDGSETDCE